MIDFIGKTITKVIENMGPIAIGMALLLLLGVITILTEVGMESAGISQQDEPHVYIYKDHENGNICYHSADGMSCLPMEVEE